MGRGGPLRRFIYSHLGWLFRIEQPDQQRYVPDLRTDPDLRMINRLFPLWVLISLAIPTILGGVLTGTQSLLPLCADRWVIG